MRTGHIHKINLDSSASVQRVRNFLRKCGERGATTAEIAEATGLMSVSTWLSHLKHNGIPYEKRYEGRTANGSQIYRYFLRERARYDEGGQGLLLE